jgi:hypothetical protein
MGHVTGPEAIIDVDCSHARGTAIEHGEQGGDAPEARAITNAGGYGDDRFIDKAPNDAGQRSLHPRHNNQYPRLKELFPPIEEAVDTRHPHIVQALRRTSQSLRRDHCLFGNGHVRGSRTHHQHDSLRQRALSRSQDDRACLGMIYRLRKERLDSGERLLTGTGGEHIAAGGPDALYDLTHLLDGLALAKYYFRKSLPQSTMVIDLRKAKILIGQVSEGLQPFFRGCPMMVDVF